jgi:hypothetical protein
MKPAAWFVAAVVIVLELASAGQLPASAKGGNAGVWQKVPDMLNQHVWHTATRLKDGRVLVAGGADFSGIATANCELFDPKTNRWVRAASMGSARAAHTATLLTDGSVLVTGGGTGLSTFPPEILRTAEIYHPANNNWTVAAPMEVARSAHSAVRLHDGRVLAVGGTSLASGSPLPAAQLEQAEVYDPKQDTWSLAGGGLPALSSQAATLMPNGTVLVTGGSTDLGFATTGAEVFDPATNRWQPSPWPMATGRYGHTATLLTDGRVLLVGGFSTQSQVVGGVAYPNNDPLTTSEIFDLRGNIGVRVGYSEILRSGHTATLLRTGTVLVVGSSLISNADSQLFYPANTDVWISTGLRMDRSFHTATPLDDGRVLIAGGFGVGSPKTAWIFSPVSGVSESSSPIGVVMQVAVVLLLLGLAAFGFAVTSGRIRRRPRGREKDSDWINP